MNSPISEKNATIAAIAINVLGMLIAGWLTFYPHPYLLAAISAMAISTAYLVLIVVFKGQIKFDTSCLAFIVCSMVMMIRAGFDFEIVEYKNVWEYVTGLSILILALLILLSTEFTWKNNKGRTNIFSSVLFILFYSFGVFIFSNCLFDQSKPQITRTTISEMKITRGTKSTTYHWYLSPWGSHKDIDHVTVEEAQYHNAHVGDTVQVQLRPGFLRTPWYLVVIQ